MAGLLALTVAVHAAPDDVHKVRIRGDRALEDPGRPALDVAAAHGVGVPEDRELRQDGRREFARRHAPGDRNAAQRQGDVAGHLRALGPEIQIGVHQLLVLQHVHPAHGGVHVAAQEIGGYLVQLLPRRHGVLRLHRVELAPDRRLLHVARRVRAGAFQERVHLLPLAEQVVLRLHFAYRALEHLLAAHLVKRRARGVELARLLGADAVLLVDLVRLLAQNRPFDGAAARGVLLLHKFALEPRDRPVDELDVLLVELDALLLRLLLGLDFLLCLLRLLLELRKLFIGDVLFHRRVYRGERRQVQLLRRLDVFAPFLRRRSIILFPLLARKPLRRGLVHFLDLEMVCEANSATSHFRSEIIRIYIEIPGSVKSISAGRKSNSNVHLAFRIEPIAIMSRVVIFKEFGARRSVRHIVVNAIRFMLRFKEEFKLCATFACNLFTIDIVRKAHPDRSIRLPVDVFRIDLLDSLVQRDANRLPRMCDGFWRKPVADYHAVQVAIMRELLFLPISTPADISVDRSMVFVGEMVSSILACHRPILPGATVIFVPQFLLGFSLSQRLLCVFIMIARC